MKLTSKKIISAVVLAGALVATSFADVPIAPAPIQFVECLCITSASQTCVTKQGSLGSTLNSSCVNGVYSAINASHGPGPGVVDPDRVFGGYTEQYRTIVGNGFTAGNGFFKLSGIPVYPVFTSLQNCTFSFFLFGATCTPTFPENLSVGSLGSNSGVPCRRAGGVTGTLHHTGYIITVNAVNTLPGGGGLGIGPGNPIGGIGTIVSPPTVNHNNFSCY